MHKTIFIGRSYYGPETLNHRVVCESKSEAVRELCNRFVPRAKARRAIDEALRSSNRGASVTLIDPNGILRGVEIEV